MSLSKLQQQVAMKTVCDFCEAHDGVIWFCRDCVNNMCDQCKRMHPKIPLCKNHTILPISEQIASKAPTQEHVCSEHGKSCQFHCCTCESTICVACLTTSHRSHEFLSIADYAKALREKLYLKLNTKSKEIHAVEKSLETLTKHKNRYEEAFSKKSINIQVLVEGLVNSLEYLKNEIEKQMEDKKDVEIKRIENQHQRLQKYKEKLQYHVKTLGNEIDNCNDFDLNNLKKKIDTSCGTLQEDFTVELPKLPFLRILKDQEEHPKLMASLITKIVTTDMFKLEISKKFDIDEDTPDFCEDVTVDLTFKIPGCKYIWSIACCDDGKVWIGSEDKKLRLMDPYGNVRKCLQLTQSAVHMAVTKNGDLLCSNGYGIDRTSIIQKVSLNFDISSFARLSSAVEVGPLACFKRGNVLVAIRTSVGRGEVLQLSNTGKVLNKVAQITKDIDRIACSEDGKIFIKDVAIIWIVTENGEFVHQIDLKNDMKNIRGMVHDRYGNLVCFRCSDSFNLRVVNTQGVLLKQFTYAPTDCKERKLDLCDIDVNDLIWLRENESVHVLKYLS